MNMFQKYKKWIITVSIILVIVGFYFNFQGEEAASEVVSTQNELEDSFEINDLEKTSEENINKSVEDSKLVVDIKGAIKQPGVYELQTGARVHHLIEMAGGLLADADELAINLAAPLTDGMAIYIPKIGEETTSQFILPAGQGGGQDTVKININHATSEELQNLTGIGPSKAEAIIAYREENGPFTSPEGLLEVSGIGEKSFEKIKEEITIK
jgi:competence protein ComEA